VTPSAAARTSWRRPGRHSGWYEASRQRVGQETFARVTCGPSGQAAQNERGTGCHHRRAGDIAADIRGARTDLRPAPAVLGLTNVTILACAAVISVTSPLDARNHPWRVISHGHHARRVRCLRFIRAG
jgi:hypothetical protein